MYISVGQQRFICSLLYIITLSRNERLQKYILTGRNVVERIVETQLTFPRVITN